MENVFKGKVSFVEIDQPASPYTELPLGISEK